MVGGQRLPAGIHIATGRPGADHGRSVEVVAIKEIGDATGSGEAGTARRHSRQSTQCRIEPASVEGGQHRPHQPIDVPRIGTVAPPSGGQDTAPQGAGIGPDDVGHHPVTSGTGGTQVTGQLQGQPATHPVRGNGQPLGGERVGHRAGPDPGQTGGQRLGPTGRIDVDHGSDPTDRL